jgi:hypothetical protein
MSPLPMHAKTNCFWNMTQKNFSRPECDLETPSAVTLLEQPAGRPNFASGTAQAESPTIRLTGLLRAGQ